MSQGLFGRLEAELTAREKTPGLTMVEVLSLPDGQRQLINWLMRQKSASLAEVIAFVGGDEAVAGDLLNELEQQGFVRRVEIREAVSYQVRLAPKRGRTMPADLWQAIDDKVEE